MTRPFVAATWIRIGSGGSAASTRATPGKASTRNTNDRPAHAIDITSANAHAGTGAATATYPVDSGAECYNIVLTMIKNLQKHGNSHALVIDKALMEALGIDEDTPLQLTLSGTTLVVSPVEVGLGEEDVRDAIAKLRPKYARMLKRLAE